MIAPLDWGLGHATRCIPLIQSFRKAGCEVYIAGNRTAQKLLQPEFPDIPFLALDGYNIRYASSKRWFAGKILQQIPKIMFAIRREHRWLKKTVAEHRINLVISDNRYGLYHQNVPCIFITHQLLIQTPYRWLSLAVQRINYRFINRFCECWVPDYKGNSNLAGVLSHPGKMPRVPVTYINPLSRFFKPDTIAIKYKWLLIVSGPEPQRTALETEFLRLIPLLDETVLLIRGLPAGAQDISVPPHCTAFSHLPTSGLQTAFAQSEYIISRSGYTTVMEIIAMQKKSILIPTPGQTEQEYLANHLLKQQWCYACKDAEPLAACLEQALVFDYRLPELPQVSLQAIIEKTIGTYN